MDFFSAMEIVASGLTAERTRMNVTASNLANAQTTRTAEDGGPYRRRDPIFTAMPLVRSFPQYLRDKLAARARTVEVSGIEADSTPPRLVYDPGHPDADPRGYVQFPNVNPVEEMVNMITASRAYEAGVTALTTIQTMAGRALGIGR
jgi:flagellar basal-body rod protein FlgC